MHANNTSCKVYVVASQQDYWHVCALQADMEQATGLLLYPITIIMSFNCDLIRCSSLGGQKTLETS